MKPKMFIKGRSAIALGMLAMTLLLPACATVSLPEYAGQHPANPDAVQAPMPTAFSALDSYRAAPARTEQPGTPATPAHPGGDTESGKAPPAPVDEPMEHNHDHR